MPGHGSVCKRTRIPGVAGVSAQTGLWTKRGSPGVFGPCGPPSVSRQSVSAGRYVNIPAARLEIRPDTFSVSGTMSTPCELLSLKKVSASPCRVAGTTNTSTRTICSSLFNPRTAQRAVLLRSSASAVRFRCVYGQLTAGANHPAHLCERSLSFCQTIAGFRMHAQKYFRTRRTWPAGHCPRSAPMSSGAISCSFRIRLRMSSRQFPLPLDMCGSTFLCSQECLYGRTMK